jgi:hypothetical protein
MCGLPSRNTWKGFVLLLFVPVICFGCGDVDTPGADKSGSIFTIKEIDPVYFDESTRQVDVVLDNCADDPLTDPFDPEPFSDHFADITFANQPLPNSDVQTASPIDLQEYEVWYVPVTQGSPPLEPFIVRNINDGNGIDPCDPDSDCPGETITQMEFVPVRVKDVLRQYIEQTGIFQLQYNIHYRFFGVNIPYGYGVSAEGSTNFYAADYDNCG